jgi:signal transduction histidine kinase/CheY-like chemotaxis protein
MPKKIRILSLVTLIATALLILVWTLYDRQLTLGVAGTLAGLFVALSLLATSNESSAKREPESGNHNDSTKTEAAPPDEDASRRNLPDFLAMLSHELRTPMNVLLGVADLMRETDLTPKQQGFLRAIQASGDSLLTLLENFLGYSELDSNGFKLQEQEFDVVELLERVLRTMCYQAYAQGLELTIDAPVEWSLRATGDPHRLRQLLGNLIGNRIKSGTTGEVLVQVSVDVETVTRMTLHTSVTNQNGSAAKELEESLSGHGKMLPLETEDMRLGRKLGLATCKKLVEKMGGQIGVASGESGGTRVWVSVPLEKKKPQLDAQVIAQEELQGKSAIVYSGDPRLDRIIRRHLETWGMHSIVAADTSSTLSLLHNGNEGEYDIAIIDANLVGTHSLSIISQTREKPTIADLPLLLLATIGDTLHVNSVSSRDNVRFLTKPVLPGEFRQQLLALVGPEAVGVVSEAVPGHLRILIAEDNMASGHMLITMLRSLGCNPDYVENGHAALEILARKPYDLVLMDCEMPGLCGDEVTTELRTNRDLYASQPVIIAVTATNSAEHRQRCLDSGMNGFIAKPIRLEELKKGLGQWPLYENLKQAPDVDNAGQLTASSEELKSRVLEQLYSRIDRDNTKILNTYIDLFLSDTARRIEDLHGALSVNDSDMLSRQSHALKGACYEIGHLRMGEYCDDLRAASEQGKLDAVPPIVEVLDKEFGHLRRILEAEKGKAAGLH